VNLSGTLVLGLLVGATLHGDAYRVVATGFLGAYTTFSAWMLESYREVEEREPFNAWVNIVVSVTTGLIAIALGRALGGAV
jgi:fluoride exporter